MSQLLMAIAMLCNHSGTFESGVLECQKYYIQCTRNFYNMNKNKEGSRDRYQSGFYLDDCLILKQQLGGSK